MFVKTESDGDFTDVYIEDAGKNFSYEINIRNNSDGSCAIYYENADQEVYILLDIDKTGAILADKPTLQ